MFPRFEYIRSSSLQERKCLLLLKGIWVLSELEAVRELTREVLQLTTGNGNALRGRCMAELFLTKYIICSEIFFYFFNKLSETISRGMKIRLQVGEQLQDVDVMRINEKESIYWLYACLKGQTS